MFTSIVIVIIIDIVIVIIIDIVIVVDNVNIFCVNKSILLHPKLKSVSSIYEIGYS